MMSTLCYYQSWKLVGEEEFAAVHASVSSRILPLFGPVLVLMVLANILLIWFHHPAISMWLIVLTAATRALLESNPPGIPNWRLIHRDERRRGRKIAPSSQAKRVGSSRPHVCGDRPEAHLDLQDPQHALLTTYGV